MSRLKWIAGLVVAALGLWALVKLSQQKTEAPVPVAFYRKKDVGFAGFVILPLSAILGTALFLVTGEQWTLANVVTVYGGLFGVCAAAYALWKM